MIHSTADIQTSAIGQGTSIWQYVVILPGASIGNNCNINCHCFIENHVSIGNDVTIKSGVYLWDGITIEDSVFIGPNATFVNNPNPRSKYYPDKHIGVHIQKGATIGANATIMGNITIGEYAMIGAGSLVTKSVEPFTLWYGNPAKNQGYVTKSGEILDLNLISKKTGKQFILTDGKISEKPN